MAFKYCIIVCLLHSDTYLLSNNVHINFVKTEPHNPFCEKADM